MSGIRVVWHGAKIQRAVDQRASAAIADAGEYLLEEGNRTVPIEEGTLQRSGSVDVDGLTASVSYDTPYAVRLHENPQYHFQHGRRGKWLALALQEQQNRLQRFLADRIGPAFR